VLLEYFYVEGHDSIHDTLRISTHSNIVKKKDSDFANLS